MGNSKFTPRLMRQEANDELEWTRESLRDRFEEEQKEEVKVERRPVKIVITGLLYLKNTVWLIAREKERGKNGILIHISLS